MIGIDIPYSRTLMNIQVPDENLLGIFKPSEIEIAENISEIELINKAMDNPIACDKLEDLVAGKKNIVVITSDHTRPVPSKITMPILLERIRKNNSDTDITILVATGYHRPTTHEELISKFGEDVVKNERFVVHNAFDDASLVKLGMLPSGGECWINKLAVEADLLIAEGFIEPHFFAGFSGGRKSVLPGVAGAETVLANHCAEFIANPHARTGNLDNNPIHLDMMYAAEKANLAFILNVVLDENKKIIKAVAGHFDKAHQEGCCFAEKMSKIEKIQADIVISSNGGYPLDQNLYQAVKGMTAAEAMCRAGGTIIMIAGCEDGHGGESFYKALASAESPSEVLENVIKIDRTETQPDQWEYQILARILANFHVILVSDLCDPQMIKEMHIDHAMNFDDALKMAFDKQGQSAKIAVIPDGVSVIPV
ncbi:MAG: nickel-dependent lactate racemase [Kiritimatiellae bacterium]|jgi:nickel-dependent lactate racemase|nr:nickel-dependent lactate racemase [Kiritimatiellia bacterium]